MPLVRFQVRNEYGLGQPELYQEINGEDPKAVLDGVAVAGLVGILRQLGDLAEFAAEVFHGLQEQVMTTASRSHKLSLRVRNIEAALPFLEKAVLAQTSHIHFAYTAGHEWHPRLQNEQNHFIYNDLPRFIMNSYEECRDPPLLHLLDKFDTGGPGSCLRRYSDPTFFRRASGFPIERNGEEFQRDKKSRKSKKKRSSQRNREISRCASFSNRSNRMQFTYPIVNGQTSQSAPADDMTFKSELGDHSNSFDSKSVSGYIDCVFDLHSSTQPDEKESEEFSSGLMQQIDDTSASGFSDERTQVVYDNFPYSPSDEQVAPSSSSVTWDEKAHIVESKDQQCDRDEFPELLETNLGLNAQDMEAANLRGADSVAAPFDNVDSPKSGSSMNQLDEIDSEPDNYVDALNTIESESENDLDHQTKREVEEYSRDVNHDSLEDGIIEPHSPDHDGSAVEPHTVSSIAMKDVISCGLPEPVSSENSSEEQMPQVSGRPLDSVYSQDADVCADGDVLNVSNVESVLTDPLISSPGSRISDSQNPLGDRIISVVDEPQGSHLEVSSVHSVKIWTNGGLLGLQPSKPPDFAVPNSIVQDLRSKSEDEVDGHPNQQKERLGKLVDNSQTIQGVPSSVNEKISVPVVDLDPKLENSGDSQQSKRSNNANGAVLTTNGMVVLGTKQPVNPDAEGMPIGYNQEIDENSSGVFGLGHRLLVNGFRRKVSLAHDGKSEPASTQKSEFMDQGNKHHSISYGTIFDTTFKDGFGHSSALDPLTSSPPLEHMKISFNPVDGFETSKLKLKIPDGSQCYENVGDMFPSFQLVPEPAIPMHDVGSDSDDDTFYRSSPYMSDDCLSHQSESNSEQWESGETLDSKDQELYDALCRMSSVESISSSMEVGETANNCIHVDGGLKSTYTENGVESSLSGSLLDIPSFDAVHPSLQIGTRDNSDSKNLLKVQSPVESTPLPPPLPPVQWRVSKPHSDMLEDKQHTLPDPLEDAVDVKLLGSSQQPKEALANEKQSNEEATASKPQNKANQWKLNGQSETKQAANGKGVDEKEDFLHQIRTKSLNLRRTTTTRPTVAPVPTTSVNVTAILEKANAIRQVVASDDGEDDDWSDT